MKRAQKLLLQGAVTSPWRLDFPIMLKTMNEKPLVYLDSGASAQKPYAVINAMVAVMEDGYANVHRGLYKISSDLTTAFEDVRRKVAAFIKAASPECIVFTKNTTEAINLVAQSWGRANIQSGDEIIVTAMEHHANIVPWQMLAAERGARIKVLPITADGLLDLAQLPDLMTLRTKMVAFTHVSNVLGTINDARAIINRIKSYRPDIMVLVDGSQGVVHALVDVTDMNADFYTFTGHKLYGPTGVGVLYAKAHILADMPPWQGGGDMIETVSFAGTTYRTGPQRFEAGTPAIVEVIGLGAAIDYLTQIGMDKIAAHEEKLTAEMLISLQDVPGIHLYGPTVGRAGIFAFRADWAHASDIAMILDKCGIAVRSGHHCAMPLMNVLGVDATVRASMGMYTNSDDIAALIDGLHKAREMLA